MEGLSINNIITNEDINITYTPSVINYSYIITKNNINSVPTEIYDGSISEIKLSEEGNYKIEILVNGVVIETGNYVIDKTPPILNVSEKIYKITTNQVFSSSDKITASDARDGDLTNSITSNIDGIDFSVPGIKKIEYSVTDTAGNITTEMIYVTIKKDNSNLLYLGKLSIIILTFSIILFFIKYIRSIKLERRFSKYTINSSKNKSISLFDSLDRQYNDFLNKMSKNLSKFEFLRRISDRYKKYIVAYNLDNNPMKIISNKIVVGILFILGYTILNIFKSNIIAPIELIIPFMLGYYIIDVIYLYKYNIYKKKIEKGLVDAITIMNNSFKAGNSIIQAIDIVSKELTGPISKEFKQINLEISLGLDIEVAFKRFADRIKLEEAVYLTSSLSILSKTGGNIIKVFNSIEKTLFSKRKLREELNSLTSSSKMISYVLMFIPLVFALFLNIINAGFFEPLFTTELGIILLIIMIIIYIVYIILVKKVMKVRM